MEKLRSIEFPNNSKHICVNNAYQDYHSVAPIQTIRVKTNTKSWLDIEVLNPIRNHDKHYKKLKNQAKKLKGIILMQNFHLKIIINKKKLLFEKNCGK